MPLRPRQFAAAVLLSTLPALLRSARLSPDTKDRLWRFAQQRLTYLDLPRTAQIGNGMRMQVSSKPRVEQEICLFGEWEPLFTRYLQARADRGGVFLDIGSNIGYFSLVASPLFDAVHAIEASPSIAARFQGHVDLNALTNVTLHNIAVGAEPGEIAFYKDKFQSGGSSTFKGERNELEATVPMDRLETILTDIDWAEVRFIKIDIEGAEHFALQSLQRIYSEQQGPVEIFVEFDPERPGAWAEIEALRPLGFSVHVLQGTYDRRDYVELDRVTDLAPCPAAPEGFCDLLLVRD